MASRDRVLYLFDVDGTLTAPRRVVSDDMWRFLVHEVKPRVTVGLVSGSDYAKIAEQMGGERAALEFDYVFCENGVVQYRGGRLVSAESLLGACGERALQRVINFALGYMARLELPSKRGNFVEFRSSMINLCPVGRSCSQAERDEFVAFDKLHGVRQKFVDALKKEFEGSGLKFALGGQISVDVFPEGWDKTYCLNHVADQNFAEIHFFGDKTDIGGNDYEIYNDSRIIGHRVTSPDDTIQQAAKALNIQL